MFTFLDAADDKRARLSRSVAYAVVTCANDRGHQRAGMRLGPLSVELTAASVDDFTWTGGCADLLVTKRVIDIFGKHGLTGFEVREAEATFRLGGESPPLWELLVTGWGGVATGKRAGIRSRLHCSACGLREYSRPTRLDKLVDEKQWDGSDFFLVYPFLGRRFASPRARGAVLGAGLSGVRFVPSAQMRFTPKLGISVGRPLSVVLGDQRAREIKERTGLDL